VSLAALSEAAFCSWAHYDRCRVNKEEEDVLTGRTPQSYPLASTRLRPATVGVFPVPHCHTTLQRGGTLTD
jgi:hypothetical protein